MSGEHTTTVFTTEGVLIYYTCPTPPEHGHSMYVDAYTVAYCLCGWAFVQPFSKEYGNAADVAQTLAVMQAREHQRNPLKGMA